MAEMRPLRRRMIEDMTDRNLSPAALISASSRCCSATPISRPPHATRRFPPTRSAPRQARSTGCDWT